MTTVLLNDNNELIVTNRERIVQRSKNVDNIAFIVPRYYKEDRIDMLDFNCTLEYLTPISHKYKVELLQMDSSLYYPISDPDTAYIRYRLPFDTCFTAENGDVELQLTLSMTDVDASGNSTQYVRKTTECSITIVPLTAWSDIIPDSALTALDAKILELNELAEELNELAETLSTDKADNIAIKSNTTNSYLTLTSNGVEIGNKINLEDLGDDLAESTTEGLTRVLI